MSIIMSFIILLSLYISLAHAITAREVRYNAGGLALGDYEADPASFVQGPDKTFRGPNKAGLTVGASHRWGTVDGFMYNIPTGNGAFTIDLIFAEVYAPTQIVGGRLFTVAVEDDSVLENLDVFKEIGANKELTKTLTNVIVDDEELTIAFIKGPAENPMLSALVIRKTDGTDVTIDDSAVITGEGIGEKNTDSTDFDHQAHSVAGGPYRAVDFNADGFASVRLDGRGSHSHYNNPDSGESGRITKYEWTANSEVISTRPFFRSKFPVGITSVSLKVSDQTGDSAVAITTVEVLPAMANGAYCYYYQGVDFDLLQRLRVERNMARPDEAHSTPRIRFDEDSFPYTKKDQRADGRAGDSKWAVRCVSQLTSTVTQQANLTVQYRGAGIALFVKRGRKIKGGPSEEALKNITATVTLGAGATPFQVIYFKSEKTEDPNLTFFVNGQIANPSQLAYRVSMIVPTINSISRPVVPPSAGGSMQIVGTGFFNNATVKIGGSRIDVIKISSTILQVKRVPPASVVDESTLVDVVVQNNAWESNVKELMYNADADQGISWDQTHFLNDDANARGERSRFTIKQITCITIGPDSMYYMGSVNSRVYKLTVGKDLVVKGQCASDKLSPKEYNRAILGIAFKPSARDFRIYVTTNSLYWNFALPFKGQPSGWANGAVETVVGPAAGRCENTCLCYEGKLITGLPVSNHDHGVNSLLFKGDDLLIGVGGFTNGGHNTPGNKLGGAPETPLSGAILLAKLSLGNAFNGDITYSNADNPASARQTGGDVSIYASGFRNSFGMTIDTDGRIWATDNGGNFGYGDISTTCTEHVEFGRKQFDELNLVESGKHYGHPNRNRGQCTYDQGTPKALVVSSTTGVTEYSGNAFGANLKGKLILSKFAASGTGVTWEGEYDGEKVELNQMSEYSGLSVTTGRHGELVMPRMQQHFVAVLKPKYATKVNPFVMNVSPRRAYAGATVFVSGELFGAGMKVKFGANTATDVRVESSNGLYCKVPAGNGVVSVTVELSGRTSEAEVGGDFIYV